MTTSDSIMFNRKTFVESSSLSCGIKLSPKSVLKMSQFVTQLRHGAVCAASDWICLRKLVLVVQFEWRQKALISIELQLIDFVELIFSRKHCTEAKNYKTLTKSSLNHFRYAEAFVETCWLKINRWLPANWIFTRFSTEINLGVQLVQTEHRFDRIYIILLTLDIKFRITAELSKKCNPNGTLKAQFTFLSFNLAQTICLVFKIAFKA